MVMGPSRRHTLDIRRVSGPPDRAWRDTDATFEGSTERGLGLVPESAREIAKRRVVFLEPRQREVHSPAMHLCSHSENRWRECATVLWDALAGSQRHFSLRARVGTAHFRELS